MEWFRLWGIGFVCLCIIIVAVTGYSAIILWAASLLPEAWKMTFYSIAILAGCAAVIVPIVRDAIK
jgi:hypothetical protein